MYQIDITNGFILRNKTRGHLKRVGTCNCSLTGVRKLAEWGPSWSCLSSLGLIHELVFGSSLPICLMSNLFWLGKIGCGKYASYLDILIFFMKKKTFVFVCLLAYSHNKVSYLGKVGSAGLEKVPGSNYFNFMVFEFLL